MKQVSVLTELIHQWVIDRNLQTADPKSQALKFFEEAGEVASGLARNDIDLVKDAIGDTYVTMVALCATLDISIRDCIDMAYDEIKDRKGKLIDGVFVKEDDLIELGLK